MNRMQSLLPTVALLAGLAGCGRTEPARTGSVPDTAAATPSWVTDLATTANAIESRPTAADSILQARGMTRAQFDSLVYEVAADSTLTAAYQRARGN